MHTTENAPRRSLRVITPETVKGIKINNRDKLKKNSYPWSYLSLIKVILNILPPSL